MQILVYPIWTDITLDSGTGHYSLKYSFDLVSIHLSYMSSCHV